MKRQLSRFTCCGKCHEENITMKTDYPSSREKKSPPELFAHNLILAHMKQAKKRSRLARLSALLFRCIFFVLVEGTVFSAVNIAHALPVSDRTPGVRDAIVAAVPGVNSANDVTEAHLAAIYSLNLNNKNITALKEGDFDGLTSLIQLSMGSNPFSSLPEGIFSDLTSLTRIDLGGNQISSLPADVFSGLSSLTMLIMPANKLSSLPAGIFTGLSSLEHISLWQNQLSSLPVGIFSGLTSLTEINFRSNQLTTLPAGIFTGLSSLTTIRLDSNQLSILPAGIFTGLSSLTTIGFEWNQLNNLSAGIFTGLSSLTTIGLGGNQLSNLPTGLFSGLSSLVSISLYRNQLSSLPEGIFSGLSSLTTLNLSDNAAELSLIIELQQVGGNQFKAVIATGAPFTIVVPLNVTNGSIMGGTTTATIPIGSVESAPFTVIPTPGTSDAATLLIGTLPNLPSDHRGYTLAPFNLAPEFVEGPSTTRTVAEDIHTGGYIGTAVSATDPYNDLLTYTLSGADTSSFAIDATTGQLRTSILLDYETRSTYTVTVNVTDGTLIASITVTINVTDVEPEALNVGEPRTVRLFYLLPNDRPYRPEVVQEMKTGVLEVQSFYAEQMAAHGHGNKTFRIETDVKGVPIVHHVDGKHPDSVYSRGFTEGEIEEAFDNSENITLIVIDVSRETISAGRPQGLGTGTKQNGWVIFYREWDWFIGSHELGHAFGLHHDFRDDAYILSYGQRNSSSASSSASLSACAADFLAVHPYFNSDVPLENESPPTVELISPTLYPKGAESVPIRLRVRDDDGLHQVILFVNAKRGLANYGPEVKACRGLTGETDSIVEFNYDGKTPSDRVYSSSPYTSFSDPLRHGIYVVAVDTDGNRTSTSAPMRFTLEEEVTQEIIIPLSDRTPQVRDAIVAAVPGVNSANDVTAAHLAAITSLSVRGRDITALRSGDFDGLTALTTLSVGGTKLSSLPAVIFDNLPTLTELYLGGNNDLNTLPAGIFDNLTALKKLYLNDDGMSSVRSRVFDNLTALEELGLKGNDLRSLPSGIFDNLTALKKLDMSYNELVSLRSGIFNNNTALTELHLYYNDLNSLPSGIFNNLTVLTTLTIWRNNLSSLSAGIFDNNTALTNLSIGFNNFSSLPSSIFEKLTNLIGLGLLGNQFRSLPIGIFKGLPTLTSLNVSQNPVDPLPLPVSLEKVADGQFKAVALTGAPFEIVLPLSVTDGSISGGATSLTIPVGSVESETLTVTRTPGTNGAVSVWIGSLPSLPQNHTGYRLAKATGEFNRLIIFDDISEQVWSGTVTGGSWGNDFGNGNATGYGYSRHHNAGSISNPTFTYRGTTYTIHGISLSRIGNNRTHQYSLLITPSFPACDEQHLTLNSFRLSDGGPGQAYGASWYLWRLQTHEAWPVGHQVSYSITLHPTVPDAPAVTAINEGNQVMLSWETPCDGGKDITRHEYRQKIGNGAFGPWIPIPNSATGEVNATSYTVLNVNNPLESTFEVRAENALGVSLPSAETIPVSAGFIPISERTLQVRDAIVAAVPSVNSANDVTDAHLATITSLDLSSTSITALKDGDFDGLTALTTLNLSLNQLSALPAGIFDDLNALTELYLVFNQLSALPADIFDDLNALTTLSIVGNQLSALPAGIFDDLNALTELRLSDNQLSTLPANIFDKLNTLTGLNLSSNQLSTLPEGIFDDLNALTGINLSFNPLNALPAGIFDDLNALTVIDLSYNQLNALPAGIFDDLNALTTLSLEKNQLSALPESIFDNLSTLKVLYLHGNSVDPLPLTVSLEKVADGQFKAVAPTGAPFEIVLPLSVTDGSISGGATTLTIPVGSVESGTLTVKRTPGTTAAVTVDIGTLPGLPATHSGYSLVKSGDLPLEVVAEFILFPVNHRTPAVRDAIVAAVRGVYSADDVTATHLAGITSLSPAVKGITSLKTGDFDGLTALTLLSLSGNEISDISALENLTNLTTLNLTSNEISDISALENLTNLTTLNLTSNEISDISALENLTNLTTLNLSFNKISDISVLEGLTNLTTLTLSVNEISDISALENLTNLTTLWLDFNRISDYGPLRRLIAAIEAAGRSLELDITIPDETDNNTPVFTDGGSTTRSVAENTVSGQNIGTAVAATDDDTGDTLTYTLGGTDAASFSIVSTSGQLQTSAALDYETKTSYSVTVSVSDGNGGSDSITVTINVTDVDEQQTEQTDVTTYEVDDEIPLPSGFNTPRLTMGPGRSLTADNGTYTCVSEDNCIIQNGQVTQGTIEVTTVAANTAPMFTDDTSTTRAIAENTAAGVSIGTAITATDTNNDILTYTLSGTEASAFSIDSSTGQLQTKSALDYETKRSYIVTITVSDGTLTDTISVTINVTDIDETPANRAPVLTEGASTTRTIAENTAAGVNIGTAVAATDADNDTLTYTLGGIDAASFNIESTTGQLKTSAALDYETKSTYAVTITVSDSDLTDTTTVTINVSDIDETSKAERAVNIPDNNLRAKIEDALGKASGAPISAAEMETLISLNAQDASISNLTGLEAAMNLTILKLGDNSVSDISPLTGLTKLTELQLWDNSISNISAVVGLTNLTRLYLWGNSISDIAAASRLTNLTRLYLGENAISNISAVAGLTNLTHLYLNENSISDISAVAGLTNLTELRIGNNAIINISAVAKLTNLVWLDAPNNSISDISAVANLTNLTSLMLTGNTISDISTLTRLTKLIELYLEENTISDLSLLVANTGLGENSEVYVTGNLLSYPSIYTHIPALQARGVYIDFDNRTPTAPTKISGDTQQGAPSTTLAQPFVVEVRDGDSAAFAGVPVTFAVTAGGGTLSVTSTATNTNGRAESTLILGSSAGTNTVRVSVQGVSQAATFTAEATTTNTAPVFTDGTSTTRAIAENIAAGINIGATIAATDANNDTLTYTLGGTDAASFSIVSSSGQLQTQAALDYEIKSSYSVMVSVSDGNGGINSITVTINVTDVNEQQTEQTDVTTYEVGDEIPLPSGFNTPRLTMGPGRSLTADNGTYTCVSEQNCIIQNGQVTQGTIEVTTVAANTAPMFTDGTSTTRSIVENTAAGVSIGTAITATDTNNDILTYTLSGTEALAFSIDSSTGQLKTKSALDYETKRSYIVTITVSDGTLIDTIAVTIIVTTVVENTAPVFTEGTSTTRSVAENTATGVNIGSAIAATDADNDTLTYTLGGTNAASFGINSTTGQLRTRAALDYETKRSYTVTVTVTDGSFTGTIAVTINVTNVVENSAPAFTESSSTTRSVAENAATGVNIGSAIAATDAENDTLTYTLSGTDAASFSIVRTSGQLRTRAALDYETKRSYTVTVTVSDGSFTDTITVTINVNDVADTPVVSTLTPVCDRTPQVRDAIVAAVRGVSDCSDVTETHLAAIRGLLDLRNKNISALKPGDFDGLSSLQDIRLDRNQLRALPADIFSGLSSLRTLYLNNNRLSSLPSTVFSGLSSLSNLYMNNNQLTSLPALVFSGLTSLRQINMHTNLLTTLPVNVFSGLSSLNQISINNNRLTSLPENVFSGRTGLIYLYLDGNRLTSLPANLFSGLSALEQLKFNNNRLSTLPAGLFRGLSSLTWLLVQGNTVNPLPFTVSLEKVGTNQFKATAPVGAPFAMTIPITVVNGSISGGATTLTIPAGDVESAPLTVTRTLGTTGAVTVDIGTLPGLPTQHQGYELVKSSNLPLTVINVLSNSAPVFTDGTSATRTIAENTASGVNISSPVSATDANNDTLTYSLSGTDAASFDIDTTNGQLQTQAALDYETKSSYTVTVTVSDGSLADTIAVTINVTDADELPTNTGVCKVGDILAPGESCTYPGTDATFSVLDNGQAQWNIPDLPPLLQWINQTSISGSLSISTTINGETYHFVAEELSSGSWEIKEIGDSGTQQPDPPEQPQPPVTESDPPTLSASTAAPLTEATLHEGVVTLTLNDGTYEWASSTIRNAVTVSTGITGVTVRSFDIDRVSDTEVIVELTFDGTDFDTNSTLTFTVGAGAIAGYDGAALTAQVPVTASTESVVASTTSPLTEDTLDGSVVTLTLSGRNYESSGVRIRNAVTVSGIDGVTVGTFDIDRVSDTQVTVELTFDGNISTDGTLTFTVGPGAIAGYNGPALTTQVSVTATTNTAPTFTAGSTTTRTVAENTVANVNVGSAVAATDANNDTLTYTLGGTDANVFSIESTTGQLKTRAALDYETKRTYTVTITVSDGNGGSDSITVTITVTNVVENRAPVFTDGVSTTRTVAENTVANVNVGSAVAATDANNDTLTYTLGGTDANVFSIESTTGQLKTRAALDYETKRTYTVTVTVSDGNGGSDSITVTITVTNVVENRAPVFTDGVSTTRSVTENTAARQNIGRTISATDPNGDTLRYNLSGTEAASFRIDGTTGQLRTWAALDYETKRTYTVTVTVSDGSLTDTITVTINVTDVDDTPTLNVSTAVPLTEATLHGSVVTLTLSKKTYHTNWNFVSQNVEVSGITGVTFRRHNVVRVSDTKVTVELEFNGNISTNSTLTFTVGAEAIAGYTGPALTAQVPVSAGTESIVASTAQPLTEATLHESVVTLTLSKKTYHTNWNFVSQNVEVSGITGVTFRRHNVVRVSDTKVTVELEFNGNISTNSTLTFTVGAEAIAGYTGPALTAQVPVSAGTESIVASTAQPLTEATLDGSVVTLRVTGGIYKDNWNFVNRNVKVSGIAGVTFSPFNLDIESDTEITVELDFDGTDFDANSTLTFTVEPEAMVNYTGPALTAQISVTALTESVVATTAAPLTEATLDGSVVTLTLSGRTYESSIFTIRDAVTVSGITGVTVGTSDIDRVSDTQVTVELTFNGNINTDSTLTFTVGADAIVGGYNGSALTSQVSVSAGDPPEQPQQPEGVGGTPTLSASTAAPLTEATLDESVITLTLSGRTYEQSNARIRTAVTISGIAGVTVRGTDIDRVSDTQVTVELTFDRNINTDGTLTFTVGARAIADYNGSPLTTQIPVTAVAESVVATTAAPLTEATLDESVVTLTLNSRSYENSRFTIRDAVTVSGIAGVTVGTFGVDRVSDTTITVELTFDGNINTNGTLTFTVGAGAITGYNGPALTAQVSVSASTETPIVTDGQTPVTLQQPVTPQQPVNTGGTPTLSVTTAALLTEATLHEGVVTLRLSGGTYERSTFTIRDAVTVSGIAGVIVGTFGVDRVSDTEVTIELEFDGNINTNATLIFTVGAAAIVDYTGPALTAQIPVTANTESVVATTVSPLTEATLDESVVTLALNGANYERSIFDIRGAVTVSAGITGVTVGTFGVRRVSDTEVTVELEFDGSDFDTTSTLTFTVGAEAIAGYNGPALTTQISVTAVAESVVASTAAPLTEDTLDGSVVTLTLSGRTYERSTFRIRGAVTVSGISGVTVGTFDIDRVSDTEVTVELTFSGDFDTNSTLTFTVGAGAIAGYDGAALTAQVPVTATVQVLRAPSGISLMHVPLQVTAVDGVAQTIESVGDLYNALGGMNTVNLLITHNPKTQEWHSYLGESSRGTSADTILTDNQGIIADMKTPVSLQVDGNALGRNGSSLITLHPGTNLLGMPLQDSRITRVSDLLALEGIRDNASTITVLNNGTFQTVEQAGDVGDIPITGGQSFILNARETATVAISGQGWDNVSGAAAAAPGALTGIEVGDATPVLALRGSIVSPVGGWGRIPHLRSESGFHVIVKNLSTGSAVATMIGNEGNRYQLTIVDTATGRAAQIGDILEISVRSPNPLIGVQPLRYTVTAEDVRRSRIQLPELTVYEIPAETELLRNYPNPFNPETWIPYRLAEDAVVNLTIYDTAGRVVRSIDVGYKPAAVYENRSKAIYWDGRNEFGEGVASGVYFYHLSTGDYSATRKMLIVK